MDRIEPVTEIKCRSHPSQVANLFLNDPNESDLFKCNQCLRIYTSWVTKVTSINSILAEGKNKVALNLCCDQSEVYEYAEKLVYSSNQLLENIQKCEKKIEGQIIDFLFHIKQEYIKKAKQMLAKKEQEMTEYHDLCGREKLKNIIEDCNLKREEKEFELKQQNIQLNSDDNRQRVTQKLINLIELHSQISLEEVNIEKDLVNTLINKLSSSFSCGLAEQKLTIQQVIPNFYQTITTQKTIYNQINQDGEYIGQLIGELRHGFGTQTITEGQRYIGEWSYNQENGQGIFTWHDEQKYVGEWKNGKKNGQGIMTWQNGQKYVGEWKEGKQNGQGTLTFSSSEMYVGEWKDGEYNGKGTQTLPLGQKYEGEWLKGKYNGQGTMTWLDGQKYVGEWKEGKLYGQGTKTWLNGQKYVGEWKDNNYHGIVTFIHKSGKIESGLFYEGKYVGK